MDSALERTELYRHNSFDGIIARSNCMKRLFDLIARVAKSQASVLIMGESGTGKELIAKILHNRSSRAKGPFIAINCSAIPHDLLESELFGHARGAFTGAHTRKKGLLHEADGGTVFLDEIGDLPLPLQAKLLRVLQEKRLRPVGDTQEIPVDFRLISATNIHLQKAIKEKLFREDLYFRLSVVPLSVPPLRERLGDIPLLADYFLDKYRDATLQFPIGISPEAMDLLCRHPWSGNVRELENTIERAVVLSANEWIVPEDLSLLKSEAAPAPHKASSCIESCNISEHECHLRLCELSTMHPIPNLKQLENFYTQRVIDYSKGSKEKAADVLGVSSRTLRRWEQRLEENS
jgi:transcriptional regulator with PAS, ATPase and Fis domain